MREVRNLGYAFIPEWELYWYHIHTHTYINIYVRALHYYDAALPTFELHWLEQLNPNSSHVCSLQYSKRRTQEYSRCFKGKSSHVEVCRAAYVATFYYCFANTPIYLFIFKTSSHFPRPEKVGVQIAYMQVDQKYISTDNRNRNVMQWQSSQKHKR